METKLYITKSIDFSRRPTKRLRYTKFKAAYDWNEIKLTNVMIPKKGKIANLDLEKFFGKSKHLLMVDEKGKQILTRIAVAYRHKRPINNGKYWVFGYIIATFWESLVEKN